MLAVVRLVAHELGPADQLTNSLKTFDGSMPCFKLCRNSAELTVFILHQHLNHAIYILYHINFC